MVSRQPLISILSLPLRPHNAQEQSPPCFRERAAHCVAGDSGGVAKLTRSKLCLLHLRPSWQIDLFVSAPQCVLGFLGTEHGQQRVQRWVFARRFIGWGGPPDHSMPTVRRYSAEKGLVRVRKECREGVLQVQQESISELSPCRFFIWKDAYIEYLRSSGIIPGGHFGVLEGQEEHPRSTAAESAESLAEMIIQLRQISEALSKIRDDLGVARVAYAGACSAARKTGYLLLSLFVVWFGCLFAKLCQN